MNEKENILVRFYKDEFQHLLKDCADMFNAFMMLRGYDRLHMIYHDFEH